MVEFTGERVIPGQVDVDLMNEHRARYAFAARLARGNRVLDAGCGSGYGSAELALVAHTVTGADVAPEAVDFARANYRLSNLFFEQASCTDLPHPDGAFDLVTTFEVIEHLKDWRGFLLEARRVLAPSGQFIVSTPNKLYYGESRGPSGSNPFHVHEFEYEEFRSELKLVFPHVTMFFENHVEGVSFEPDAPAGATEARVESGAQAAADTHFFVAVCAQRAQIGSPTRFVCVPQTANVLKERERHISVLERELTTKNEWLAKLEREHQKLVDMFRNQKEELDRSNRWAADLNLDMEKPRARVVELQNELAREQANAQEVAQGYENQLAREQANAQEVVQGYEGKIAELEAELEKRTAWARTLDELLATVRASAWVRIGRKIGFGPAV